MRIKLKEFKRYYTCGARVILFLFLISVSSRSYSQREHKVTIGLNYGFEFPGFKERVGGEADSPVRLLPNYTRTNSKGIFIAFDNSKWLKPEFSFTYMNYSDWQSETGSFLFLNSDTRIAYFGLNFRKLIKVNSRTPAYFYLLGGINYGLISFEQGENSLSTFEERQIPSGFKVHSPGVQYGGMLCYRITGRVDLVTRINAHNSFFNSEYLEESSHFSFGLHFGFAYNFNREKNPFIIL